MINTTNITQANTTVEIIQAVNNATSGGLFVMILFALFVVVLFAFRNRDIKSVLVLDSFLITLVSMMAFSIGFIVWQILLIPIVMLFATIIIYMFVD